MRWLPFVLLAPFALPCHAQEVDAYTGRYTYAFVEDQAALLPLRGRYSVEYLARGQWWSYTDPRLPVDYAGKPLALKPLLAVGKARLMAVEPGKDWATTDQKLRVVRGQDTLIVDLSGPHRMEERMRQRTAAMDLPPRPPVLIPFRKGWFDLAALTDDTVNAELCRELDARWVAERKMVLACYDTARYTFGLPIDEQRSSRVDILIDRDPNYRRHVLRLPATGDSAVYELVRMDDLDVPDLGSLWKVHMPSDGRTDRWVDVTDKPAGKYTVYLHNATGIQVFPLFLYGWKR